MSVSPIAVAPAAGTHGLTVVWAGDSNYSGGNTNATPYSLVVNPEITSAIPKKSSDGMDFVAVYEKQSDGGKDAHGQRNEVVAGVVGGNTREQEGSQDRAQADR